MYFYAHYANIKVLTNIIISLLRSVTTKLTSYVTLRVFIVCNLYLPHTQIALLFARGENFIGISYST